MAKKSFWDKTRLRVLSRHPSHKVIRNLVLMPNNMTGVCRLGSTTPGAYDVEINTVQSVENTMDKLKMKQFFRTANVQSPEFFTIDNTHVKSYENGSYKNYTHSQFSNKAKYPLIAKKTFRSRGQGMVRIDNAEEFMNFVNSKIVNKQSHLTNPYYFESFVNFVKEYRIHVSSADPYFYANRKMLKQEYKGTKDNWYRNDSNCVWFLETNSDFDKPSNWDEIVNECNKAREALGLDIAAIDIKISKDGKFAILEANSAPSFGEGCSIVATRYQAALSNIIAKKLNIN